MSKIGGGSNPDFNIFFFKCNLSVIWSIINFFSFIFFSFILNFLISLYSDEENLFKIDLESKSRDQKKLIFLLKNIDLFISINCVIQVLISSCLSIFLKEILKNYPFYSKIKNTFFIFATLLITLFTDLLSRYFSSWEKNKYMFSKRYSIQTAYSIIRPFSFLRKIIKPKKRLFFGSEDNVITLIKNLKKEKILGESEANLARLALEFDEKTAESLIIRKENLTFVDEKMNYEEVKTIHIKHNFTLYPVLKNDEIIGILDTKKLFRVLITTNKNFDIIWKKAISTNIISLFINEKLSRCLFFLQVHNSKFALIKDEEGCFIGVISRKKILNFLLKEISLD